MVIFHSYVNVYQRVNYWNVEVYVILPSNVTSQ